MPELDEFGIPKKTTTPVDEFGIPVKKKDGGLNGTTTPAPSSQSVSPSPSVSSPKQVTYNDIENILAQTREAEKSFYNATQAPRRVGDKFDVASGVEAQYQSGVDEQKKQSKVILDQRTAEKNRILKDNARAISRPVDRIFEEGKYKDFFTEDGAFDYEKATDHFNEYVKKYGGGTFLRETWVADLKKRGQFEMDRPQYEGLLNGELKKAGIDMNKYGKQTFDNLAAKQYTQLSTVKSESEKEANAAFRVVQGTADESVKAFNNFVTNIDEQVKLGQISSEEGRKMYETKKAELDATLQSLNTKYKNDVMGINARVNKRYGRIENELKAISNQVTNQKVWESIPEKDRAVIMKAQDNAFKKLQEQKNAARKGRDYAGQMTGGPANLLTQSLVSGFNRGLANIGDHLIINKFDNKFSQWMRSMYTTADQTAPAQYEFNKDEWLKRATVSTGSSIGASAPILVPTFIASVATGGGAAGTIAAGLISMEGEGVMQSGDTFRNNIERDGDVVKAAKNADQAQAENRKNLPFYFISGMGEQMLIKAKGLKSMLGGFGLELSEEIPVEYRQQYITAKQDGYKGDLVQFVKDNPEIALETAMSTAGQSGSFAVAGKAIGMLSSKVPEANTQFLTDMIQAKGVDFGKQVLQKYFEQGLINEQELKAQTEQLTKLNGDISKLKELNVDGNAAKVFTVLSIQSDQLKRRIEAEKNDAAKIILQKQLADVTGEMKGLVDNTTPYVVFNLPGGMNSTRVMTERQFNSLSKEDADKLVQAADGFEVVGNDEFKANLETKKAELGIPAGVTDGAYTTAAPEVSNIDSSKRETIKNKFDFITDNDFTEESFTPEEDAAFRENLPESGIASEEELNTLLERGEYAMLTGQNPDAVPMSREANAKLNEKAKAWLAERGLKPVEIFGKYGNSERSFLVPGMTKEQAVEFAQEFQQDSVAHSSGLVYKDGSYNPRTEGVNLEDRFDNGGDFFSTINVGGKKVDFSINYDFDKKITPDSTIADEILRDVLGQSQDTQSAIDNIQKALESTGVKVEVINDETVFEQKTGGQRGVDGLFVAEDGTILLNDKRLKESGEAGRIIFHEGAHPVMNIIRNTNRPLYDQVVAGLKEAAANNKEIAASLEWSKDTSDVEDVQNDEAIVETIAKIADGTLDPNTIETGLRQKLIDLINLIAKALGLGQIAGDTDVAAFKKLASEVANALAGGEDVAGIVGKENVNEYQNNIQIGTEVGPPTQLRKGEVKGEDVSVKDNHALSFVKQEDIFDLPALVKEIQDKGQKVWFWVADQLGRGNYYDKVVDGEHYLDAGPSFALDPENRSKNIIWATGKGEKWINDKIANSDYIFIISGSPSKSKLFNKRVAELTVNRIKSVIGEENAWETFKNEVLSVSKIGKINNIMNEFSSFEDLLNSPKRKDLLIEFDNQKEKKGTPLKALLEKYNAFVDYDELRDGFYKDNDFKQNDVMLVLKPTGFGGQSKHSTYENDVLGEVIGVPNKKINAFDLMPADFKIKYEKELSRTEQSQAVAPYGVGIRNVQARRSAPNGKPSNLNEQQWNQVRTPEFKAWFGDWENDPENASKALDENGEPRVVFHGTNEKFDAFSKEKLGSKNWLAESAREGFFFAGNRSTSEGYTGMNTMEFDGMLMNPSPEVKQIMDEFETMAQPLRKKMADINDQEVAKWKEESRATRKKIMDQLRSEGKLGDFTDQQIADLVESAATSIAVPKEVFQKAQQIIDKAGIRNQIDALSDKTHEKLEEVWKKKTGKEPRVLSLYLDIKNPYILDYEQADTEAGIVYYIKQAKRAGNDGVIIKNMQDGGDVDDVFVAFEPNQIKSATDNSGAFSKTDNRIQARKSSNLVQDAKLDKKMTVDGNGNYVFYHYSAKKFSKVDPNKFGSNTSATGRDERPGMGMSMFYTKPDMREPGVSGDNGYIVRVPMDKVYPFNKDPLNFYDEAKARFEKQFPGQAFEPNKQLSFITQVANENGFPMTVAKWNIKGRNGLRAQTTQALKVEPLTEEAQNYKAQARKSALEQTTDFKLAAFVMRKKAEGATPEQIATGIKSAIPSMTAQDIAEVAENPEVYINKKFAYLSEDLRANLIGRAKVQNIYKATPKNAGAFTGFEVEMDLVREALKNNRKEQFKEAVKDFGKKWLTASKGLPDWVLGLKDRATGGKNFEVDRAARIIAKLKATAKKIGFNDWDAFSKAMVAMGNQPVREMSNGTDIAMYDPYRAAAAGPALQDNELPATVPDEVKVLPAELVPFVYQMRGTIDRLTQDLVGSGYVSPEQAAVLESNLGQYVNRAYRLFNEKGYKPTPEAFENAVKFIADQKFGALLNQYYGVNAPASTSTGSTAMAQFGGNLGGVANIPWDAIKKQALDEARKEVNAIVSRSKNPYFSAKTESRNTGILQERKDIPEAIRKVMGEYTDPGTVFIMTVGKQAALKASSEYLTQLREKGLGTIFFEENDPNRPVTHSVKIASDTGETKAPLNGLYTTPQIAEELDSMEPTYNSLVQLWMKTVGAVRWGKTVGSVVTQFKNFESNIGFAVMNGLLFSGNNAQAVKSSGNYVKGQYTKGEVDALTEKVMKLGLVGQSVGARELASMLSSGDIHDIAVDMALNPKSKFNKVKDAVGMPFEQANKLYRLGDDFWKVYAYINEREQLGKALFGDSYDKLTPEQQKDVDVEASERVKNTWPTYDRIFEAAKYISKRAPIFGNFVSFQAESLRVLGNTFLIASQDMKSDNKDIQALGLRRFLGVAMYIGLRAAILSAVSHAAGIAGSGILAQFGGDEEEKRKKKGLNKAMPTFMRVGDIAVVHNKKEPWKYTVYNLSSIDPYGLIPNSLNAITEGREGVLGNTMQPGVIAGLVEMFSSFTEPEMTFAAMYSVLNNANRKTGGQIVLENDSNGEAAAKIGKYLFDQLKPSTIDMIERLHERDNKSAELSAMAGARPYDVDLHKSFRYAVSSMIKELASVNTKFGSVNLSEKSTEADKLKAERDAEEYKAKLINNMHQLYKDFVLLGAQPDVLNEIIDNTSAIRSTGFDKQTKKAIKSGDFDQTKLYKQRK